MTTDIEQDFPLPDVHIPARLIAAAYTDLRARAIAMEAALRRVANLNPDAGEIGAGMIETIVQEARAALNTTDQPR